MNQIKNQVNLIGRLGQDPEVRQLTSGTSLARFSLATSERYKNKQGDWVENTQWHRVIAWGKLAEVVGAYFEKGAEVAVSGKIQYRTYEGKDGKRTTAEIVAQEALMLQRSNKDQAKPETKKEKAKA